MHKDVRKLAKQVEAQGFTTRKTSKNHLVVSHPDTRRRVTTLPGTPSDRRTWNNCLADLKRAGFIHHA